MNAFHRRRFLLLIMLGSALFVIQIAGQIEFLRDSPNALHPTVVRDGIQKALASPPFLAEALFYFFLGTITHALILFIPIALVKDITKHYDCAPKKRAVWTIAITILFLGMLLMWNNVLFPFSDVAPIFYVATVYPVILYTILFLGLIVTWLSTKPSVSKLLVIVFAILILFLPSYTPTAPVTTDHPNQTNVILIGIDSLRPDHLFHSNDKTLRLMPKLENWLSKALVYDDAVTPMARTFPALTSLLTAKYPINNGARINLTAEHKIDLRWTLAKHLQRKDYATSFAIDGARFVNISAEYGFDILETPQQGLPDFIFGDLIDSVGTNLLNLFPIAIWLNPVQYGNSAAGASYRPGQFDYILKRLLGKLPSTSTFLMTHFDLAHLPYVKKSAFSTTSESALPFQTFPPYERGLRATDTQFDRFITALESNHMLDDAVVVVYSDHGEEFNIDKDRAFRDRNNLIRGRLGHGSSIFSPSQSRILIAFQHFKSGQPQLKPEFVHKPALLTDISPTILHLLAPHSRLPENLDGVDLRGYVPFDRVRYMESSILFPDVASGEVDRAHLLEQFGDFFYVTDSLRVRTSSEFAGGPLKQLGSVVEGRVTGIAKINITGTNSSSYCTHWTSVAWHSLENTRTNRFSRAKMEGDITRFFQVPAIKKNASRCDGKEMAQKSG